MKIMESVLVGAMIASLALSAPAFAAGGQGKGQVAQKQTNGMKKIQKQQRLRDGSCTQSGTMLGAKAKRGNNYGPGDGSGYQGDKPEDGTRYEVPDNQ